MIKGESIAKRDHRLSAHHMVVGRDQHEPVFGERKCLKFFGKDSPPSRQFRSRPGFRRRRA